MNRPAQPDVLTLEFETARLRMRPLQAADEALFRELYTDTETMRYIGEPLSSERAARSFRKTLASSGQDPPERVFLAILDKATRCPLGICAIAQFDATMTRAEVGIMLKSDARSRGYAREGLGGLVKRTFSVFPVSEIWVECSARNLVVEHLFSSSGFTLCGEITIDTEDLSQRIWSAHRSSWSSINAFNQLGEDNV